MSHLLPVRIMAGLAFYLLKVVILSLSHGTIFTGHGYLTSSSDISPTSYAASLANYLSPLSFFHLCIYIPNAAPPPKPLLTGFLLSSHLPFTSERVHLHLKGLIKKFFLLKNALYCPWHQKSSKFTYLQTVPKQTLTKKVETLS